MVGGGGECVWKFLSLQFKIILKIDHFFSNIFIKQSC